VIRELTVAVALAIAGCSGGTDKTAMPGSLASTDAGASGDAADLPAGRHDAAQGATAPGNGTSNSDGGAGADAARAPAVGGAGDAGAAPSGGPDATAATVGKLFWLAIVGNQVMASTDTGGVRALITGQGISAPDGVAVDVAGGKMYWTNMGTLTDAPHTPAGSVQRANLDGSQVEVLLQPGVTTNTPKQLQIDLVHRKIYWSDREGAKAWRANLDGSAAEVLLSGHGVQQLVGMALDVPRGQFYVTDRYAKNILRAGFDMPAGQDASTRSDVETLVVAQGSAMPIDIDLDLQRREMYWTDRGVGSIERAPMDLPSGQTASNRTDVFMLMSNLSTPIGISLDLTAGLIYFTELGGQVSQAKLDGTGRKAIASSSGASGIVHVDVPAP
jgi:hypothetical protein